MKKVLIALAALPFMAGVAAAGQPQQLNDKQMDGVTAGFSATAIADAQGRVGPLETVLTTTATLSAVTAYATSQGGLTLLFTAPVVTTAGSPSSLFGIPHLVSP